MPILRRTDAPTADAYASPTEAANFEAENPNEHAAESAMLQAGWDVADRLVDSSRGESKWTRNAKFGHEPKLIAFIKGAPIDSFHQHWVTRQGQQSFRCPGVTECPLCKAGSQASAKFVFHILDFETDADGNIDVSPKIWTCGIRVLETLRDINGDPRKGGPIEGKFFSVHRVGEKQKVQYVVTPVKARDLDEDWGIPSQDALAALQDASTHEVQIFQPDPSALVEVAREIKAS